MKRLCSVTTLLILALATPLWAADVPSSQPAVTREEFEQLKKDNADMKKELAEIKKQQNDQASNSDQEGEDVDKQINALKAEINKVRPGDEGLVIAGDCNFGFAWQKGATSTFFADMSPLILWQPTDSHFLIEAAFDLGIGGQDINSETTTVTLNLADISYNVCDYCTVGTGLFAVPFGQYHNHFDPPWVDKFPDDPLAFDAIAPSSEVGAFVKGVFPSGTTRWTYDVYLSNGPNLDTVNSGSAGQLNFDDFTDLNNNKAVGGRIGFLPFTDVEMGYSIQYSQPNPNGFQEVHARLQAADFHWKPVVRAVSGQFDLAAEWIWSDVGAATYFQPGASGFGPLTFSNYRQGGYVSLCYRPTMVDNKFLRNLEFCTRFDSLQSPVNSPGGEHESRYTLGLDYWFTPYCVLKAAYEIDHRVVTADQNAFTAQIGFGL